MGIGDKIRRKRRDREYSQEYVAERLRLTQAQVSRIENNESDPDSELIIRFAKVLEVSPGTFFEDTEPEKRFKATFDEALRTDDKDLRPVYAEVPAGRGRVSETPASYEPAPPGVEDEGKGFWLRVKGSSMFPALKDKQLVFVNPTKEVHDNDFAVVTWEDHREGAIKVIHFTDDDVVLSSVNQLHEPIVVPREKISMMGRICYLKL